MSSSKEEIARREGMSYAFRYAKEHGLEYQIRMNDKNVRMEK